jgi:putative adenylate-forming enzyme
MRLALGWKFLVAYRRARRFDRIRDRQELEALQASQLERLRSDVVRSSAFYRQYAATAWHEWPIVDKSQWMKSFDRINTVGARLAEVSEIAHRAERSRDFSSHWRGHTVGMSTGTSGNRGVFLVSQEEGAQWAGTLLGKLLRRGLLARERIALILRAGASLYDAIGALRLQFRFFDQARPWQSLVTDLRAFDPTILIGPASALRLLADAPGTLRPRRIVSVAEVLDELDRGRIERGFGLQVEQIYQATEGLLGMSCERGTVHLNEPYVLIEPEWQDAARTRFIPVVTDLWRRTQPVIRYRLNDVLQTRPTPCECGRAATALAAIEGRSDDILWLDGPGGPVAVFPDLITRIVVSSLADVDDFRVMERRRGQWSIALRPLPSADLQRQLIERCHELARQLSARSPEIDIVRLDATRPTGKQRRVLGLKSQPCAS